MWPRLSRDTRARAGPGGAFVGDAGVGAERRTRTRSRGAHAHGAEARAHTEQRRTRTADLTTFARPARDPRRAAGTCGDRRDDATRGDGGGARFALGRAAGAGGRGRGIAVRTEPQALCAGPAGRVPPCRLLRLGGLAALVVRREPRQVPRARVGPPRARPALPPARRRARGTARPRAPAQARPHARAHTDSPPPPPRVRLPRPLNPAHSCRATRCASSPSVK